MKFVPCVPCAAHRGQTGRGLCMPCQQNKASIEVLHESHAKSEEVTQGLREELHGACLELGRLKRAEAIDLAEAVRLREILAEATSLASSIMPQGEAKP